MVGDCKENDKLAEQGRFIWHDSLRLPGVYVACRTQYRGGSYHCVPRTVYAPLVGLPFVACPFTPFVCCSRPNSALIATPNLLTASRMASDGAAA